jgi:hypothetical protein
MTPEQKAAYVISQAACALAELEAMKAANWMRERRGEVIAYSEEAFMDLDKKYCIGHNAVIGLFLH